VLPLLKKKLVEGKGHPFSGHMQWFYPCHISECTRCRGVNKAEQKKLSMSFLGVFARRFRSGGEQKGIPSFDHGKGRAGVRTGRKGRVLDQTSSRALCQFDPRPGYGSGGKGGRVGGGWQSQGREGVRAGTGKSWSLLEKGWMYTGLGMATPSRLALKTPRRTLESQTVFDRIASLPLYH